MTKVFCDKCGVGIPLIDDPHLITIIGGDEYQVYHYCADCYPRVSAELIPVLKGRVN